MKNSIIVFTLSMVYSFSASAQLTSIEKINEDGSIMCQYKCGEVLSMIVPGPCGEYRYVKGDSAFKNILENFITKCNQIGQSNQNIDQPVNSYEHNGDDIYPAEIPGQQDIVVEPYN